MPTRDWGALLFKMDARARWLTALLGATILVAFTLLVLASCAGSRSPSPTGPYPLDMSSVPADFPGKLDVCGVPMWPYAWGYEYNPVTACRYALGCHQLWLRSHDAQMKAQFLCIADWLCNTAMLRETGAVWEYAFDVPNWHMKAPWISAMAQGMVMSVLVRAHDLTMDPKYLALARQAVGILLVPAEVGGVLYKDPSGWIWYEEYPSEVPTHVLNGFIFTLFGLWDLWRTGDERAGEQFRKGVESLCLVLPRFDSGTWSLYDLDSPPMVADRAYHKLHIDLLRALERLTHERVLSVYAQKFSRYMSRS